MVHKFEISEKMLDTLAEEGYLVLPKALPPSLCQGLSAELLKRYTEGLFTAALIGQGVDQQKQESVRSDSIHWLESTDAQPELELFFEAIRSLIQQLNRSLFLAINAFECHFACYEPGAFYQKHRDRFQHDNGRRLSLVFFLNADWQSAHQGELVIYDPKDEQKVLRSILPELGTLVLFASDRMVHEVKPTLRLRLSITGWLKSISTQDNPWQDAIR